MGCVSQQGNLQGVRVQGLWLLSQQFALYPSAKRYVRWGGCSHSIANLQEVRVQRSWLLSQRVALLPTKWHIINTIAVWWSRVEWAVAEDDGG